MVNDIMKYISQYDPQMGEAAGAERGRKRRNLGLIAALFKRSAVDFEAGPDEIRAGVTGLHDGFPLY